MPHRLVEAGGEASGSPQRLKPLVAVGFYGTAEAVPLPVRLLLPLLEAVPLPVPVTRRNCLAALRCGGGSNRKGSVWGRQFVEVR